MKRAVLTRVKRRRSAVLTIAMEKALLNEMRLVSARVFLPRDTPLQGYYSIIKPCRRDAM